MAADLRATAAYINLDAIKTNVELFREAVGPAVDVMAVVKADGYGHGAVRVAEVAVGAGATWLGVAVAEEGAVLREAGLTVPILVLGASNRQQAQLGVQWGLDLVISEPESLQWIVDAARPLGAIPRVHLKVDTGMGRLGVAPESVVSEWVPRLTSGEVRWQGLMSHLADSDGPTVDRTKGQLSAFLDLVEALRVQGIDPPPSLHIANSAATLRYPGTHLTMVRVGVGLYGALDIPEAHGLAPAMRVESVVVLVKRVPRGALIGYGGTYRAPHECTIATIPIGYADGYRRAFSNVAEVLIHGRRCAVAGRVSMDQVTVVVPDDVTVSLGDRVVLLGEQGGQSISIRDWAGWADTITYEMLTGISGRVPRIYPSG